MGMRRLIDAVIDREGGYVDHPADRGGPTNMGITQQTLSDWRKQKSTKREVADLGEWEARAIYYAKYWVAPGFDNLRLPEQIQDMVLDAAIHHGPTRAIKMLQEVVRARPDGLIGPITGQLVVDYPNAHLGSDFIAKRVELLGRIVTALPQQAVFAKGWMARAAYYIRKIPGIS